MTYYLEIHTGDEQDNVIVEPLNAKTDLGARRLANKVMKAYKVYRNQVNLMFVRDDGSRGRLAISASVWA